MPEAVSVLGFAFYLTPCLFPLLHELPAGPRGAALAARAARWATLGAAQAVFGLLGVFGAARYGLATSGSLLADTWLGGGVADGALDAAVVAYLAISMPPMALSLRYTLDAAVAGEDAPGLGRRRAVLTAGPLAAALGVALAVPAAEKIFSVTGALPVCAVCYVLPAAIRLRVLGRAEEGGGGEDGGGDPDSPREPLLDSVRPAALTPAAAAGPAVVASLGIIISGAAAWLAVADAVRAWAGR